MHMLQLETEQQNNRKTKVFNTRTLVFDILCNNSLELHSTHFVKCHSIMDLKIWSLGLELSKIYYLNAVFHYNFHW
jgi:hypothetical protein